MADATVRATVEKILDDDANCLGVVCMPEHTNNLAWGDDDLLSLCITASTSL